MTTFEKSLKTRAQSLAGKDARLGRSSDCIRVTLKSGKECWATVKKVESDFFTIAVTYTGGGEEDIAVRFADVAAFSLS